MTIRHRELYGPGSAMLVAGILHRTASNNTFHIDAGDGTICGRAMNRTYVHGYDPRENVRLQDQASTLVELLHSDTKYPAGSEVLEAGCGVGAQTVTLAQNSPGARITSVDISERSVVQARKAVEEVGCTNVVIQQGDIFDLPFDNEQFDHLFVCFVLEHLPNPIEALNCLKRLVKVGGTITVIEGDHGSTFFYPDSEEAHKAIRCQVELQGMTGGNSNIGRELYPILNAVGFRSIRVSPRMVYVDASKPHLVEGFTKKTFTAMIEGVRAPALEAGILTSPPSTRGFRTCTERPKMTACSVTRSSRPLRKEHDGLNVPVAYAFK